MNKPKIDFNAAAAKLGLSKERAFEALKREAANAAREATGRARAEPRPDWIEARERGAALADFVERAFEQELASGEMHRGLLSRYGKLQGDYNSLRRSKGFPERLKNLPTLNEWNTRQLKAGKAKQASAVRPRTKEQRLYEVEQARRRRAQHARPVT